MLEFFIDLEGYSDGKTISNLIEYADRFAYGKLVKLWSINWLKSELSDD